MVKELRHHSGFSSPVEKIIKEEKGIVNDCTMRRKMQKIDYIVVLKLSLDSVKTKGSNQLLPLSDSPDTWNWSEIIGEKVELLSCQKMKNRGK